MKKSNICWLVTLLSVFWVCSLGYAADQGNFSTKPTTKNGKKWRIGYYEGGAYIDYPKTLVATVKGLMDLKWVDSQEIPLQESAQTKELWNWLATNLKSQYLEFVPDAHYTANWDIEQRKAMSAAIIARLNQQQDIDLLIAMGTRAGQDLANDQHHTPLIVLSASDPVASKIIKSAEDSGYDHVHARVDPFVFQRQIQIFHDIIQFQKLGITYRDDDAGRSYAAISDVENVAAEAGFEIVRCLLKSDLTTEQEEENVKACFQELGKTADAIYVTAQKGVSYRSIPDLVNIANTARIPTFSQSGSEEVQYGFLMSISLAGFKYLGQFHAETIAKVFNGAKPRQLDQVFEDPSKIAINLKTAEIIGYDPPVDVLGAADEIFTEIIAPPVE